MKKNSTLFQFQLLMATLTVFFLFGQCMSGPDSAQPSPPARDTLQEQSPAPLQADSAAAVALPEQAPLLSEVCSLAQRAIYKQDSVEIIQQAYPEREISDSLIVGPLEDAAYEAILAYKKLLAEGAMLSGSIPDWQAGLPDVDAAANELLPAIKPSYFTSTKNFFFLGGGIFMDRLTPDGFRIFVDLKAEPELRYAANISRNTQWLLDVTRRLKPLKIDVEFGLPLITYESGPMEIKGIGSLVHEFTDHFPVYFLSRKGFTRGRIVSVEKKLADQDLGCVPNQPRIVLGIENFPNAEILGVFITYNQQVPPFSKLQRDGRLWLADLDGDTIYDLAAISDSYAGISDDILIITWYANIGGKWATIDHAEQLDCT